MSLDLRRCVIMICALSLAAPHAGAQLTVSTETPSPEEPPQPKADPAARNVLRPGLRIRVFATGWGPGPVTGSIESIDDRRIVLEVEDRDAPIVLQRSSIQEIGISLGRHSGANSFGTVGLLAGGLVGGVLGMMTASMANLDCESHCSPGGDRAAVGFLGGALVLGLAGGTVGVLVGSAVGTEDWKPVPISPASAHLSRRGGSGLSASLSIRF